MDEKDAVTQPAEQPVETESAPVEEKDTTPQPQEVETPVESNQPEKKESESVPYERFHEVNSKAKQLEEENAWLKSQVAPPAPSNVPQLDPEVEPAVRMAARMEWDEMERQKFVAKHKEELDSNLALAGTIREIMARENAAGRMADRETVYLQAKKVLEQQINPAVKEAKTEGFKEAQEKAVLKTQAGAVGDTNYKAVEADDKDLTAEEMRKKYNIPRI